MNSMLKTALALTTVALAAQASAQVTFYESEYFQGRSYTTTQQVDNMAGTGFNDRASSAIVQRGRWRCALMPVLAAPAWCCALGSTRLWRTWA